MRIKPRNKYWTYLLTLNVTEHPPCINRSRHAHAEIHIHRWRGGGREQYLESTRIERSRRAVCHQYTWSMYIPFHARVLVFRSFCASLRTRTRVSEDARARIWAHMRARYPRLPELREAPDGNCPSPTPPIPISRGPNLHTYDVTHDPL